MSSTPKARCWRVLDRARGRQEFVGAAAGRRRQQARRCGAGVGTDAKGHAVLTTSSAVPRLGWHVFFEQPTAQALTPIRDQLVRIALLIGLGLVVAIIAGTIMARRMLVPITALRAGARRLGAGDFGHRIEVKTADELEELANQFNGMAGQLAETYSDLEAKVKERTRDLAQSINELKVLEEVGRAVASSLDLNAVLPTVAARALEITHADAVLIYGYDAGNHQFNLTESIGIDKAAEGAISPSTPTTRRSARPPATASRSRFPISARCADIPCATSPSKPASTRCWWCRWSTRPAFWARWWCCGGTPASSRQSDRADEDLCAPGGAGDAQCAAVHRSGPQEPRARDRQRHRTPQADKLQEQTDQLKDWNKSLEERVETQLGEIERIRRLERFLAPQVAQLIASSDGHEGLLDSHRREVTVVFCDLRGFTAFTEATEPEEAMNVLREYHAALGELIFSYEGTLDRYAGDGVMILFNAPIQFEDHTKRAVKMASRCATPSAR